MSCWRVLHVSDSDQDSSVPQLLIKPNFRSDAYTVFLTDLSNIWSEELGLDDILRRASEHESPIEVSRQDRSQLTILLEHVKQSLVSSDGSTCRLTKGDTDAIVLHTASKLPDPLGSLTWTFNLRKRNSAILKDELILPLLVSSHIQHERIHELLSTVREKDRAITRFLDQLESSNIDLALAFPSLAPMKAGRRAVKRELAARQIPALHPLDDEKWMQETGRLKDDHVCTLALFQEALSECNPKVPAEMISEDVDGIWWKSLDTRLRHRDAPAKKTQKKLSSPPPPTADEDDTETEDEFETHENFKVVLGIDNRIPLLILSVASSHTNSALQSPDTNPRSRERRIETDP
ncbi:XLF-domain-containing protein [Westerdykella ornata]|uniref:Non-homologous end-joining factor 1 n=1 Tax=Westerdykella ornata TaxID=318751 RepID=A0A6A6JDH9_WESOR|nr:XLF-domain-containing protein [Westerdykella ornata]KAF2274325.1 XLF-domain-containing protein [Westerdykella ornata]